MEDNYLTSEITGVQVLSYIGIGSLMISATCVLLISIICCYNVFFNRVGAEWLFRLKFFERFQREVDTHNPSPSLLANTTPPNIDNK